MELYGKTHFLTLLRNVPKRNIAQWLVDGYTESELVALADYLDEIADLDYARYDYARQEIDEIPLVCRGARRDKASEALTFTFNRHATTEEMRWLIEVMKIVATQPRK